ncbi:hypothetical protein [Paenibacillus aceti]|uniref:Uncharacterized protein n=1 Tax=Paenibacillus aceti TaxID=1820010 RepID=A0ABQ1W5S6_9BACL|nr:hypothetical protein [Paenibacillus aceti]GGG15728.1 hypothetical protein GCM10010913_42100 [Paenibacillus aceti]
MVKKIKLDGCDAFLIKDDLYVLINLEDECAVIARMSEIGGKPKGMCLESPISLKALHKILTADNELDILIAALEG